MNVPAGSRSIHFCLAALHYYGFSVAIPSPLASPDGVYVVVAHGPNNRRLTASRSRLDDAVAAVAWKLGEERLAHYALHVGPDAHLRKQAEARKAGV